MPVASRRALIERVAAVRGCVLAPAASEISTTTLGAEYMNLRAPAGCRTVSTTVAQQHLSYAFQARGLHPVQMRVHICHLRDPGILRQACNFFKQYGGEEDGNAGSTLMSSKKLIWIVSGTGDLDSKWHCSGLFSYNKNTIGLVNAHASCVPVFLSFPPSLFFLR